MSKKTIAAFDFDGTLIRGDSFLRFIVFSRGWARFVLGCLCCSPVLAAYLLGLVSNHRAKERVFSFFFKGMDHDTFARLGRAFSKVVGKQANPETLHVLKAHQKAGHQTCVISASIEEWVAPWCREQGIDRILCTGAETKDGKLTGRFSPPNCYGQEKVDRLLQAYPRRDSYFLEAYGDSKGDDPLLRFADTPHRVG